MLYSLQVFFYKVFYFAVKNENEELQYFKKQVHFKPF